ncbi:hypothetical protein FOZ62_014303, partial [Perkinsus olseni]
MYYPRREWQHVMTYDIQAESVDPFWMALVHYRPAYTCKQQYNPANPNEMRWECAEHVDCNRKVRILKDGAQMKISISGDHTNQARDLKRVRFPPHIEQYILDAAARGENASHILAHALEEYPEFSERLTKTRVSTSQVLLTHYQYDARRKKYVHSFVPFLWSIAAEESAAVYDFMLGKLDELVKTLSANRKSLVDVATLCVHDAHQGAISASRCFYHFSKNLRDNKKKVGAAYDMVERCIFPLHISTNDDMFTLLASAMIEEAREVSVEAERYLSNTLDTDRYGYPNIAITAQGLEGTQVVNNIVEALNSIMSKALDGESFDIGIFVREAVLIMRSVKKSSPQCFISRPTPVIMKEYHPEMRQKGTAIFDANGFKEVTEMVSSRMDVTEGTRFFLFASPKFRGGRVATFPRDVVRRYLDGVLLGDFGEGGERNMVLHLIQFTTDSAEMRVNEILDNYYCYYLVTARDCGTQDTRVCCTCKDNRDWSLCEHGYCAEISVESQMRFVPGQHRLPTIRRGRRSTQKRGPLERTYSGISAPPVHRQSESAQQQGDPNLNDAGTSDMSSRSGRESIAETVVVAEQSDWESLSDSQAVRTCGDTHSESASRSRSDPVWECLSDLRVSQTEGTNAVTHMSPQPVSNSEVWESLSDLIEDTSMQPPPEQEPLRLPSDVHE